MKVSPTTNPILFDNVPYPPECHIQNAVNPTPSVNLWLSLSDAQQKQQPLISADRFSGVFQSGEIQGLWMLNGLEKIRVYYAKYNEAPIFLIVGVDADGNNLPGVYLLDPNPVGQAVL